MSSHIPSNVVAGLLVLPILVGLGKTEAPSERIGKEVVAASLAAIVDRIAVAQALAADVKVLLAETGG